MVLLNSQCLALTEFSPLWTETTNFISKAKATTDDSRGDSRNLFGNQSINRAFELFHKELKSGSTVGPSSYGFSKERLLSGGLQLHAHMVKTGLQNNPFPQTSLLGLYSKCESLEFARRVFDTTNATADLISWNSMITMYCQYGFVEEALSMFLQLQNYGHVPDQLTFSVTIKLIGQQQKLSLGCQLHCLATKAGYVKEESVSCSLIQMYASCGRIYDSVRALMGSSETVSAMTWNSTISRLVDHGFHAEVFEIYKQMQHVGTQPTPLTFSSLLKSCADTESLFMGQQIHSQVIVRGFSPNMILETALLDFYTKCGELENGRQMFERMEQRNVITWNSMIRGYSQVGDNKQALKLLSLMRKEEIVPDKYTFPALLAGASSDSYLHGEFKSIHAYAIKVGLERDCFVGSSLITMYSTNNCLENYFENVRQVFDDICSKDVGVWSSIISASMKSEQGEEALRLFTEMLNSNLQPNQFIYSSLLTACGELSILETGKQVHAHGLKSSDAMDTATQNSLVTMYSNCGCIQEAWRVFNSLENPNVISFNSMISACAQHGCPREAAELFDQLRVIRLRPDEITILNLLSAFNHAGLVREGLELFKSAVEEDQGVKPGYQHYACVVDMLSRAGEIDEAMRFISAMPFKPDSSLWRIVLGACSKHRNLQIGKQVSELLLELEPYEATNYILLANTYARSGRWVEAERLRHLMKDRGIEKEVGFSWIEINKATHTFGVEDRSHPLSEKIHERLHELIKEIKATGYVPDISFTLHDMEDVRREESLYYHSEKLAFAFGDLLAARGVKLRIMKNLRVCGDCHSAYKHFSMITSREIILRDKCRFHHFTNGLCSCGDYW